MVDDHKLAEIGPAGVFNHRQPAALEFPSRVGIKEPGTARFHNERAKKALACLVTEMTVHVVNPLLMIGRDIPLKGLGLARFHVGIGIGRGGRFSGGLDDQA